MLPYCDAMPRGSVHLVDVILLWKLVQNNQFCYIFMRVTSPYLKGKTTTALLVQSFIRFLFTIVKSV